MNFSKNRLYEFTIGYKGFLKIIQLTNIRVPIISAIGMKTYQLTSNKTDQLILLTSIFVCNANIVFEFFQTKKTGKILPSYLLINFYMLYKF